MKIGGRLKLLIPLILNCQINLIVLYIFNKIKNCKKNRKINEEKYFDIFINFYRQC